VGRSRSGGTRNSQDWRVGGKLPPLSSGLQSQASFGPNCMSQGLSIVKKNQ
jgi:hypothetical protein